jgi:flagellar hook-length control protein FliK
MYNYLLIIVIGIIMPQLNISPVNVSKNIELKDDSAPFESTTSKDDFSKYIDLHLTKNKEAKNNSNVDSVKSEVDLAKKSNNPTEATLETKQPNDLAKDSDKNDKKDSVTLVQKIAAPGNKGQIKSNETDQKALLESEQLMLFLTKADNTLINQSVDTSPISSPEQTSVDQNAQYEAELLLSSSNLVADLSAVAKAIGKDQVGVTSPAIRSKQVDSAEELLLSHAAIKGKESASVKLPVESIIESETKDNTPVEVTTTLVKPTQNKPMLSELSESSMESKTEARAKSKTTDVSSDHHSRDNVNGDKTKTLQQTRNQGLTSEALVDSALVTQKSPAIRSKQVDSAEELLLSHVAIKGKESASVKLPVESIVEGETKDNTPVKVTTTLVKSTQNNPMLSELSEPSMESKTEARAKSKTLQQTRNQGLTSEALVDSALVTQNSKAEVLSRSQLAENEKINTNVASQSINNQAKPDAVKSLENAVEGIEKQVNTSKQTQPENRTSVPDPQLTKSQITQSSESTQNSEVNKSNEKATQAAVTLNKNTLASNQSTTGNLSPDEANITQTKQDDKAQLAASLAEKNQQKLVAQPEVPNKDAVFVEDKGITNTKIAPSANRHLTDVSGNVTQTPQHIIEQQSAEMLNPNVATEVTQSQKTNAQLHQETISLFRKDFTEAVKDKVMLMISQKLQRFDITLDPPELGNMQVRVNLQGEQAVVSFLVQSQQTKDALEQNMYKLRESLAEQGVDVGDANVEQQSQQSANDEGSLAGNTSQIKGEVDNMAGANDVVSHTLSAQMLDSSTTSVDYYA